MPSLIRSASSTHKSKPKGGSYASYDTPEFDRPGAIHVRKWETCEGVEPIPMGSIGGQSPESVGAWT